MLAGLNIELEAEEAQMANASGPMDSMEKMLPSLDDVTFWLVANVVLFLYVGVEQLIHGYGPGAYLSAGAVLLPLIYLALCIFSKTSKTMAVQWMMLLSGLAILGDLIVIANNNWGSFTGTSAILDIAGLMLFRAAYKELKGSA